MSNKDEADATDKDKKPAIDLKVERAKYLVGQLKEIIPHFEELTGLSSEMRQDVEHQITDYALSLRSTKLLPDELEEFFKHPYVLLPVKEREGSWRLIIPKFVDIQFGWLEKQTPCYDEKTRVLTHEGFKFFKDVTYNDDILTLNKPLGRMEYHNSLELLTYEYDGSMIHFKGRSTDLLVTPNHNVLVAGKHKYSSKVSMHSFKLVRADSLLEREDYSFSMLRAGRIWRGRWQTKKGNSKDSLKEVNIPTVKAIHGGSLKLSKNIPVDVYIRFIGWWLTEGSTYGGQSPSIGYKQYRVTIANTNTRHLNEIRTVVRALGFSPVENKNPDARSISFSSKQWFFYLQQFGKAHEKYIPTEIKNLPSHLLHLLLDTMRKGDGHSSEQGEIKSYTSASQRLAEDVAEIGIKLGYGITIHPRLNRQYPTYDVLFSSTKMPRLKAPSKVPYKGKVYCLTVPNHILLVERNGKICWSGNSYNIFLIDRYMDWLGEIPEEIKKQLGFKAPPDLELEGEYLIGPRKDLDQAQTKYGRLIRGRDERGLKVNKKRTFELIAALIKDGVLPFTPQPVPKENLVEGRRFDFELRPYQKDAWKVLLQYSNIGVYYPASVGKTIIGIYAMTHLKGPHLVVCPSRTLVEQWTERIVAHTDLQPNEYVVTTYHSALKKHGKQKWGLLIIDEHHHIPADYFSGLSLLSHEYTMGLTASPQREDSREEYIFALTGKPVGLGWDYFKKLGIIKSPTAHVWIVKNFQTKIKLISRLTSEGKKTLIFSDSIEIGETISKRFNVPFVSGKTGSGRLEIIGKNIVTVVSRVADEGVSIPEIQRIIEISWLGRSRRQELQRFTRLLHSKSSEVDHHILMTMEEYAVDRNRLFSVMDKGFKIEIHREGVSEVALERQVTRRPVRRVRPVERPVEPEKQVFVPQLPADSKIRGVLELPGIKKQMTRLKRKEQKLFSHLLKNDGDWYSRNNLVILMGFTSADSMRHSIDFQGMERKGLIEIQKTGKETMYRTNMSRHEDLARRAR